MQYLLRMTGGTNKWAQTVKTLTPLLLHAPDSAMMHWAEERTESSARSENSSKFSAKNARTDDTGLASKWPTKRKIYAISVGQLYADDKSIHFWSCDDVTALKSRRDFVESGTSLITFAHLVPFIWSSFIFYTNCLFSIYTLILRLGCLCL